ncbi:MAG: hypothetical protein WC756_03685 [Taibaiella sp.]|jgi:hypothetical protein
MKANILTDASGKKISVKTMLRLLPEDIEKLDNFINTHRGAYVRIEEKTGVGDGTIRAGRAEGWLFSIPTLFKLKDFIRNHLS